MQSIGQRFDIVRTNVAFVNQIVPESEDAANDGSMLRHLEIRLHFLHPRANGLHSLVEITDHLQSDFDLFDSKHEK